ncbi:uncharacterized protein [Diadema setosum]|uniref:uncharacterized protein isoform X2 n=1 Tax=Diadema setosum TaxID=31175 RepID=UPI003B3A4A25
MASKRKQDDKHLKLLREMVSKENNKTCFECNQRGPTYVDMTIGSFVCTSCSGILRGINPPHRVKSISMASYTSQEIEFLQKHGNEVCRTIWLGLYDSKSQPGPDSKEDGKVRDYLVQKYEKKRWYVEPSQAAVLAAAKAKEAETAERKSTGSTHSTPEPKPLKSLVGNAAPLRVIQPPASSQQNSKPPTLAQTANKQKSVDLLADLGGDPFASSAQPAAQASGFGQVPFGQAAQPSPFGQPAQSTSWQSSQQQQQQQSAFGQQMLFGQPAQQAAFPQPQPQAQQQQQGGFADFSQAFGGPPQTSGAFMPAPQAAPSQAAQPATNNFGAFESAFTPAPAPIPASSASVNQTAQGLQGLSLSNSTPTSGASQGTGGADKYAAFASLGDTDTASSSAGINWGGGGSIDWGGSSGGGGGSRSSSSSGIDWGTGMAKSTAQPMPVSGSLSASSLGATTTTSSAAAFGSVPFGAGVASSAQGNPFMSMSSSGATQPTSTMATNPFLGGGAPVTSMGGTAQPNGLFGVQGMQPSGGMPAQGNMMMGVPGGGAFGQVPQQQAGLGGGANMQMNGRVVPGGFPPAQMGGAGGFGMQPVSGAGGSLGFGGAGMAAMAGLQFGKMGQGQSVPAGGAGMNMAGFGQMGAPQQPAPQGQQFGAWGAAPGAAPQPTGMTPNPFMGGGFGQAQVPPKSNASNPFL